MRALLLSAGLGTRLRPLTNTIPKCLVPVHGKPLIEYWLDLLSDAGVSPVLVNLHYFANEVSDYINKSRYSSIVRTVYEEKLLGTAGTLLKNRNFFENKSFMLIHGDNLSRFDLKAFIARHTGRPSVCDMTMMTFTTPAPESCGIVELDSDGIVRAFHEKVKNPPGNLANGAVYILEPTIFNFLENIGKEVIDFSTDVLPNYVGRIFTFHNDIYHRDIGTMESYKAAEQEWNAVKNQPVEYIHKP